MFIRASFVSHMTYLEPVCTCLFVLNLEELFAISQDVMGSKVSRLQVYGTAESVNPKNEQHVW